MQDTKSLATDNRHCRVWVETRQLDYTYRKKRHDSTVRGRENDSENERGEETGETERNKTQHDDTLTTTDKN